MTLAGPKASTARYATSELSTPPERPITTSIELAPPLNLVPDELDQPAAGEIGSIARGSCFGLKRPAGGGAVTRGDAGRRGRGFSTSGDRPILRLGEALVSRRFPASPLPFSRRAACSDPE